MTSWDVLFIVLGLGVGLIAGLVLINRNAFERRDIVAEIIADEKKLQELYTVLTPAWMYSAAEKLDRERQEVTRPIDVVDLEAVLEDDSLEDTDPPTELLSNAEVQAIEWLSRNE